MPKLGLGLSLPQTRSASAPPFIDQIIIDGGSYLNANGAYTRSNSASSFTKTGGIPGSIFFSEGVWYISSTAIGNVAGNSSSLGSGAWLQLPPGNSSGISASYSYSG